MDGPLLGRRFGRSWLLGLLVDLSDCGDLLGGQLCAAMNDRRDIPIRSATPLILRATDALAQS